MITTIRTACIVSLLFFTHIDIVKADDSDATKYKVTTFNIEWYGLGGSPDNGSEDEYRDANLKKYMAERLSDTDVLVVEEIIDLERLEKNVLAGGWKCKTYHSPNMKHQHVGMCLRPGLQFMSEPSDDNDIIDQVASDLERSRPALHLIVANERNKPLFRLIGVHLKAAPDFSNVRLEQAKQIADYIQSLKSNLPIVITGDFNTYSKADTRQNMDDDEMISRIWSPLGLSQTVGNYFTYKTPKYSSHFDRFWVSSNVRVVSLPISQPECQYRQNNPSELNKIKEYNRDISDHCPVTLSFSL
jgi:hypothetical protein